MFSMDEDDVISFDFFAISKDRKEITFIGKFDYKVINKKILEEFILNLTCEDYTSQSNEKNKIALLLVRVFKQSIKEISKTYELYNLIGSNYNDLGNLIRENANSTDTLTKASIAISNIAIASVETTDDEVARLERKESRIRKINEENR